MELLGTRRGRGGGGSYGNGERRRWQRSGGSRERDPGEGGERERVREVRGGAWRRTGVPGDEGEAREEAARVRSPGSLRKPSKYDCFFA